MPTNPDPDLMRLFNFTADDLEANRAERLSDRQVERLATRRKNDQRLAGIGCLVVVGIAIWMTQIVLSPSTSEITGSTILIFLIIGGLVVGYVYLGAVDRQTDLDGRKIKSDVSGIYISQSREKFRPKYYDFSMTPLSFQISKALYKDIQAYLMKVGEETEFRVYYTAESKELLSIEVADQ